MIISVLVECDGRKYRVVDNLFDLLGGETDRCICEHRVGRKVIDLVKNIRRETAKAQINNAPYGMDEDTGWPRTR